MIFIDTGAFYARSVQADAHHRQAVSLWPKLAQERVYTSSLVVCETAELLARRTSTEFAVGTVRRILSTPSLTVLRPTFADELAALGLMTKYADQRIGFADCVSFVLMKQNRIRRAFSFDQHFHIGGLTLWPDE